MKKQNIKIIWNFHKQTNSLISISLGKLFYEMNLKIEKLSQNFVNTILNSIQSKPCKLSTINCKLNYTWAFLFITIRLVRNGLVKFTIIRVLFILCKLFSHKHINECYFQIIKLCLRKSNTRILLTKTINFLNIYDKNDNR